MAYSREVYDTAMGILNEYRFEETAAVQERKNAFYHLYPRAAQIERELSTTAVKAAKAVLNGGNTAEQLKRLKESNLALQQELRNLLIGAGLQGNYLNPEYHCAKCGDTGYIDGRMCVCLKELLRKTAYQKLNAQTPLSLSTFGSFSLDYYPQSANQDSEVPPRKQMEKVVRYCQDYATGFSRNAPSLLMQGGTGLGKTHLSLAIANDAIQKGYGVIYGSAQNMASNLEQERFGRDGEAGDTNRLLLGCDLLILDDLGTEFSTSFVDAAIYNIINTRLMSRHPTIISTNLNSYEFQKRYSERFVSRIIGSYVRLAFFGKDIRQQKRMKK